MIKYRHLLLLFFVFSTLFSCDFENKIRRLASDPSGRKRDSLKPDEVSSKLSETEPNATIITASSLTLTKEMREISGEFVGTDLTDWFDILLPELGDYEVIVTPSTSLDISLFLEKSEYAFNQSDAGGAESVKSHAVKRVRFGIKREKKTEGSYKIKVVKFAQRKNLELEPNSTAATANDFDLVKGMVGKINQIGDRDVFKVIAAENERWELQLIPTKGDLLTLKFCEDMELVSCSQIYHVNNGTLRIPAFGLPSKKMPLYAVLGSEKVSASYQLLALPLSFKPDTILPEIEPNDSFPMEVESVVPQVFFKGYLKSERDIDRFKVLNWKNYSYRVVVNDPDLSLEVEGQKVVSGRDFQSCSKTTEEIAELKFSHRKDRPPFQGYDYRIFFAEQNIHFEQEPNNTKNTAQVIDSESKSGDTSSEDADVFVFEVKDEKIEYYLSNFSSQDIHVSITDDEGFDVLATQTVRRDKALKLKFDFPKGKYFVTVVGQSKSCSPYQLSNALSL